jgi:membrane protein
MKNDRETAAKHARKKLASFVDYIWDIELSSVSWFHRLGVKVLRVVHLVFKGFRDDECSLHASALTFSTLMAIVPVLALSLALARGFGDVDVARAKIKSVVMEWTAGFKPVPADAGEMAKPGDTPAGVGADKKKDDTDKEPPTPEIAAMINDMVDKLFKKVENMKFKALGGVGLVLLIWMAIDVLGRAESAFNKVWGVTSSRTLVRKFTDYLSVVIVLPVLLIAASSLPVVAFLTKFFDETVAPGLSFLISSATLKSLTTIVMSTLGFTFLISFLPNTKVKLVPGLTGGFVTALFFIAWLWLCAALQIGVANYGKIYGSFAVIPILLAWVFVSWGIILFGAEVAFAVQNCTTFRMEQGARRANVQAKIILALSVVLESAKAFAGQAGGFSAANYGESKRVPVRFLNEIVDELVHAGVLGELSGEKGRFVLLRSPDSVKVKDVIDVIMCSGVEPKALGLGTIDAGIERILKQASDGMNSSLSHMTVQELMKG